MMMRTVLKTVMLAAMMFSINIGMANAAMMMIPVIICLGCLMIIWPRLRISY